MVAAAVKRSKRRNTSGLKYKSGTVPRQKGNKSKSRTGKGKLTSRRKQRSSKNAYNAAFDAAYNQGYNLGFAKGFEDGHQIAYEQQNG